MIELSFIVSFFAEFVLAFICISLIFELTIKPSHAKSRLVNLLFFSPFYLKMISFNFVIDMAILSFFFFYNLKFLILTIKYKGKFLVIKEYEKGLLKPKYGLNNTIEKINEFIKLVLFVSICTLISFFLAREGIIFLIGIASLIIIVIIMFNHIIVNSHSKKSTKIDSNKIKVNLFTLFSLILIFSILIFISLSFIMSSFFPSLLELFHIISFFTIVLPLYVSNHLINKSRLTFFRDKDIAKIFISNITNYLIICLVITIILSDIPVALIVLEGQNIVLMNLWVYGFNLFITYSLIIIYKNSLLFGLESKIINIDDLM